MWNVFLTCGNRKRTEWIHKMVYKASAWKWHESLLIVHWLKSHMAKPDINGVPMNNAPTGRNSGCLNTAAVNNSS